MIRNRIPALPLAMVVSLVACSGSMLTTGGTGGSGSGGNATGGNGSGGSGGSPVDGGHDASSGACWQQSDCHVGSFCTVPGQSLCGGACPIVTNPCSVDTDCATDAGVPLVCVVEPCVCGPTNMGCVAGCSTDADCGEGEACLTNHHCGPIQCGVGIACPTNFVCGDGGACVRKACTSDSQCASACVEGLCYSRPGSCQLEVP
jgi:hypothetical protein